MKFLYREHCAVSNKSEMSLASQNYRSSRFQAFFIHPNFNKWLN